jgi:hypothetical protein
LDNTIVFGFQCVCENVLGFRDALDLAEILEELGWFCWDFLSVCRRGEQYHSLACHVPSLECTFFFGSGGHLVTSITVEFVLEICHACGHICCCGYHQFVLACHRLVGLEILGGEFRLKGRPHCLLNLSLLLPKYRKGRPTK